MSSIKNTGTLPRIFTCSDAVNREDYVDIDFSSLNLANLPAISAGANVDVNIHVSDVTTTTARIHFSQKFVGTVYYTVIGFN